MRARTAAALPFEFGPPFVDKPTHELLGEILLEAGRPQAARLGDVRQRGDAKSGTR